MPTSSTNPKLYHVPSEDSTKFCPVFKKALLFDPKYLDKKPPFQPCSSSKDTRALERDREGGAGSSNFIANGTKSAKNEISKHMQLLNVYEDALGGPSFGPSAAFQAEERRTIRCLERDVLLASKKKSERGGQARKQGGAVSKEKVVYYAKDAKSKPVVERMDIRPYPPNPNNLTPQQMQQRAAAARFLKPLSETIGSVEHAQNLRLSPSFLRDVLPSMSVSRLVEIGTVPPDGVKPDEDPREQLIKALEALEGLEEGQGQLIVKDREPPTPGSTVRRASVVRRQSVLAQANLRSARGSIGSARGMPPSVKTPSRHPAEKMGMAGALAYADDSLLQQHINWVPVYACQLASAAVEYRTGRGGAFLMSGEGKGDAADEGDPSRMEDPLTYTDEDFQEHYNALRERIRLLSVYSEEVQRRLSLAEAAADYFDRREPKRTKPDLLRTKTPEERMRLMKSEEDERAMIEAMREKCHGDIKVLTEILQRTQLEQLRVAVAEREAALLGGARRSLHLFFASVGGSVRSAVKNLLRMGCGPQQILQKWPLQTAAEESEILPELRRRLWKDRKTAFAHTPPAFAAAWMRTFHIVYAMTELQIECLETQQNNLRASISRIAREGLKALSSKKERVRVDALKQSLRDTVITDCIPFNLLEAVDVPHPKQIPLPQPILETEAATCGGAEVNHTRSAVLQYMRKVGVEQVREVLGGEFEDLRAIEKKMDVREELRRLGRSHCNVKTPRGPEEDEICLLNPELRRETVPIPTVWERSVQQQQGGAKEEAAGEHSCVSTRTQTQAVTPAGGLLPPSPVPSVFKGESFFPPTPPGALAGFEDSSRAPPLRERGPLPSPLGNGKGPLFPSPSRQMTKTHPGNLFQSASASSPPAQEPRTPQQQPPSPRRGNEMVQVQEGAPRERGGSQRAKTTGPSGLKWSRLERIVDERTGLRQKDRVSLEPCPVHTFTASLSLPALHDRPGLVLSESQRNQTDQLGADTVRDPTTVPYLVRTPRLFGASNLEAAKAGRTACLPLTDLLIDMRTLAPQQKMVGNRVVGYANDPKRPTTRVVFEDQNQAQKTDTQDQSNNASPASPSIARGLSANALPVDADDVTSVGNGEKGEVGGSDCGPIPDDPLMDIPDNQSKASEGHEVRSEASSEFEDFSPRSARLKMEKKREQPDESWHGDCRWTDSNNPTGRAFLKDPERTRTPFHAQLFTWLEGKKKEQRKLKREEQKERMLLRTASDFPALSPPNAFALSTASSGFPQDTNSLYKTQPSMWPPHLRAPQGSPVPPVELFSSVRGGIHSEKLWRIWEASAPTAQRAAAQISSPFEKATNMTSRTISPISYVARSPQSVKFGDPGSRGGDKIRATPSSLKAPAAEKHDGLIIPAVVAGRNRGSLVPIFDQMSTAFRFRNDDSLKNVQTLLCMELEQMLESMNLIGELLKPRGLLPFGASAFFVSLPQTVIPQLQERLELRGPLEPGSRCTELPAFGKLLEPVDLQQAKRIADLKRQGTYNPKLHHGAGLGSLGGMDGGVNVREKLFRFDQLTAHESGIKQEDERAQEEEEEEEMGTHIPFPPMTPSIHHPALVRACTCASSSQSQAKGQTRGDKRATLRKSREALPSSVSPRGRDKSSRSPSSSQKLGGLAILVEEPAFSQEDKDRLQQEAARRKQRKGERRSCSGGGGDGNGGGESGSDSELDDPGESEGVFSLHRLHRLAQEAAQFVLFTQQQQEAEDSKQSRKKAKDVEERHAGPLQSPRKSALQAVPPFISRKPRVRFPLFLKLLSAYPSPDWKPFHQRERERENGWHKDSVTVSPRGHPRSPSRRKGMHRTSLSLSRSTNRITDPLHDPTGSLRGRQSEGDERKPEEEELSDPDAPPPLTGMAHDKALKLSGRLMEVNPSNLQSLQTLQERMRQLKSFLQRMKAEAAAFIKSELAAVRARKAELGRKTGASLVPSAATREAGQQTEAREDARTRQTKALTTRFEPESLKGASGSPENLEAECEELFWVRTLAYLTSEDFTRLELGDDAYWLYKRGQRKLISGESLAE